MNEHSDTCRCALHRQLQNRRHDAYRQLAFAILGPSAPREDIALARALADHAALREAWSADNIVPFHFRAA